MKIVFKWEEHGECYATCSKEVEIKAENLTEAQKAFEDGNYSDDAVKITKTEIEEWYDMNMSEPILYWSGRF